MPHEEANTATEKHRTYYQKIKAPQLFIFTNVSEGSFMVASLRVAEKLNILFGEKTIGRSREGKRRPEKKL
jgi:hypothetical protein